ncbi:helix-turn-helix domain-containing protein, partial [Streptomyces prunicolor]|uniref:helix-turn-helix domain-containing protein n=1 Tax=Streptomyces prunicolor TaxID=67348 RepID=UPI0033FF6AC1
MNQLDSSLRELKTRTGLSLAGLAAKTPYSKSSWERYLNGKTLPPREAVEELCQLAGEPEGRCVALWEIAEAETSGRGASETPPPPPPAPIPIPASARTAHGDRVVQRDAGRGAVVEVGNGTRLRQREHG